MVIENVHLSQKAKDQLIKLKRITGIQNWNILCRWGFCVSIADSTIPPFINIPNENAVEMSWRVFGGQHHEIYTALLKERCKQNGLSLDKQTLSNQFRLHLHRGIGQLSEQASNKNIDVLFNFTLLRDN
ncbi:MAG: DNA sulfur modification protein DndE [Chlorobium sp.]|nr:DNA sulfur modification protein DndE [Chlorobium sp.]